jgi:hypothetical protein
MAAGEVLFADGDLTYDLFVVLAGEVRLIERHDQPGETVIASYPGRGPLDRPAADVADSEDSGSAGFQEQGCPLPVL